MTNKSEKPGRSAAIIAAVAAIAAALAAGVGAYFAYASATGAWTERLAISGGEKPGYQALCIMYSDFVLNQAHNGYTPEQIERVIDFAGSHSLMPGQPDQYAMPNRWPSISDVNACGTPAQIIEQARSR